MDPEKKGKSDAEDAADNSSVDGDASPEKKKEKDKEGKGDDPGDEEAGDGDGGSSPKFDIGSPDGEDIPHPDEELGCDIDFLFVVDNSGSMRDEQQNLASSVPGFIETITNNIEKLEEYHIGVVSTDENRFNGPAVGDGPCTKMGGLVVKNFPLMGGKIRDCAPYANGKNFMTREDDLKDKFECAASIGTLGSGNERPLDAMFAALGPELNAEGACNEGFFRKNAILVVVLISDEEDDHKTGADGMTQGSKGDPKEWYQQILALKDNRPEYVVVLSLIGTPKPNECEQTHETGMAPMGNFTGAEIAPRLREFTELFKERGFVGDVCAKSYDKFFEDAVGVLELACTDLPG